jgi:cyclopropane fatty-acyl-phospholipid synthase-like methyltransferase
MTGASATRAALRPDLALLCDWIRPGSRILDLGCGDGALLSYLAAHQRVSGYGLEVDPDKVARCVKACRPCSDRTTPWPRSCASAASASSPSPISAIGVCAPHSLPDACR